MSFKFEIVELGVSGEDYYKNSLPNGNSLSSALLDVFKQGDGIFFTALNPINDRSHVHRYQSGGLSPHTPELREEKKKELGLSGKNLHDTEDVLVMTFFALHDRYPQTLMITEDATCGVNDPWMNRYDVKKYLHSFGGKDVYWVIRSREAPYETITNLLISDNWFELTIICCPDRSMTSDWPQRELAILDFEIMAKTMIFCGHGAYDGEGYVFWARNDYKDEIFSIIEGLPVTE